MLRGRTAQPASRRACGHDSAQMLLLTSVILLIGFIALSSMVIRVTQLPEETTQDARRPIDLEADAVAEGVRHLLQRMQENPDTAIDAVGSTKYTEAVQASLGALVDLEKGRGFRFESTELQCATTSDATSTTVTVSTTVTLQDFDTRIQVTIQESFTGALNQFACT